MEKKYQSELLGAIHEDAVANFEIGAITEEELQEYNAECLVYEAEPIEEVVVGY